MSIFVQYYFVLTEISHCPIAYLSFWRFKADDDLDQESTNDNTHEKDDEAGAAEEETLILGADAL